MYQKLFLVKFMPLTCNFIKKDTSTQEFSCEFCKIFRTNFLHKAFRQLCLKIKSELNCHQPMNAWMSLGASEQFVTINLKHQPHKIVKHTKTICWLLSTNCLSVFDHFVWLALKRLLILWKSYGKSVLTNFSELKCNINSVNNYVCFFCILY